MVLIKIALVNEVSMLKIILENIFTFQKWTSHDIWKYESFLQIDR